MSADSKKKGETALMRRLAWAFLGRLFDKYPVLMCWLKCRYIVEYPMFLKADYEGPDQLALPRKLIWAFVVHKHFLLWRSLNIIGAVLYEKAMSPLPYTWSIDSAELPRTLTEVVAVAVRCIKEDNLLFPHHYNHLQIQ